MNTSWTSGTVTQLVKECAQSFETRPYILPNDISVDAVSYHDLLAFCVGLERRFRDVGVVPGSRIIVDLPNSTLTAMIFVAVPFAGRVFVPVHPSYRSAEVEHIITTTEATMLISSGLRSESYNGIYQIVINDDAAYISETIAYGADAENFEGAIFSGDAPAEIVFTSGSSGKPKGILLSHANLLANSYTLVEQYAVTSDDMMLTTIPLTHVGGQTFTTLGPLWVGAATTIVPPEVGMVNFWAIVEKYNVTWSIVMAAFLSSLLLRKGGTGNHTLRGLLSGGSAVSGQLITDFEERFGVKVYQVYGQTEMTSTVVSEPPADPTRAIGSVGKPLLGVKVSIVDETGSNVGANERGEILLSGPTRFLGYVGNEQLTQDKLRNAFVKTGDCGFLDHDNNLFVVGRLDDMVIVGGENVYPAEVEARAVETSWVESALVLPIPHDILGQQLVLIYKSSNEIDSDTAPLVRYLRDTLSPTKVPRILISLDALHCADWPRIPSGKVDRLKALGLVREYLKIDA